MHNQASFYRKIVTEGPRQVPVVGENNVEAPATRNRVGKKNDERARDIKGLIAMHVHTAVAVMVSPYPLYLLWRRYWCIYRYTVRSCSIRLVVGCTSTRELFGVD